MELLISEMDFLNQYALYLLVDGEFISRENVITMFSDSFTSHNHSSLCSARGCGSIAKSGISSQFREMSAFSVGSPSMTTKRLKDRTSKFPGRFSRVAKVAW